MGQPLALPLEQIAEICRRHHVRRLSIFGSATTDRFDPERSDADFYVEFIPARPYRSARPTRCSRIWSAC